MNALPKWKRNLMIQSMSPMFLIVFILNLNFAPGNGIFNFLMNNICKLLGETILLILIIFSVLIFLKFKYFEKIAGNLPHKVDEIEEGKEASLSFFLTYILPISLYDFSNTTNLIAFVMIVLLMFTLMKKTNLFYANPVLNILGYKVYKVKCGQEMIIVSLDQINVNDYISVKAIDNEVCLGKLRR